MRCSRSRFRARSGVTYRMEIGGVGSARRRESSGRSTASVFPVTVGESRSASASVARSGNASRWISVGSMSPCSRMAASSRGSRVVKTEGGPAMEGPNEPGGAERDDGRLGLVRGVEVQHLQAVAFDQGAAERAAGERLDQDLLDRPHRRPEEMAPDDPMIRAGQGHVEVEGRRSAGACDGSMERDDLMRYRQLL